MAWSADGERMFLSHSKQRAIHNFARRGGSLADRRVFATLPPGEGILDGAAMDADSGYWCALHGAGRMRRFHPDGTPDRDLALPVSQPTMCAFAGPELDMMYVTSATDGLTPAQQREEPLAGALLRLRPGRRSIPRRCTLAAG